MTGQRVVDNLNSALHQLFEEDPRAYLVGEDLLDPYGGAFKVSKGLSTRFPDRVLTTPISEAGLLAVANGLALCGDHAIAEIMFGDFLTLAFDQFLNFAAKSPTMYGEKIPHPLLVRCPVGGNRGYGATHSQSLQKHFIGIPNLDLYELSPLHDSYSVLSRIFALGRPAILFENKSLYGRPHVAADGLEAPFCVDYLDGQEMFARARIDGTDECEVLILCGGGMFFECLTAAKDLFVEEELECEIRVPSRIYPFDADALADVGDRVRRVVIVEEGTAGGTWGAEIAQGIYSRQWSKLAAPIQLIHARDAVIPSSPHLERQVLPQANDVFDQIVKAVCHA